MNERKPDSRVLDHVGIRKPQRTRGIKRVDHLLNATEALLERSGDVEISLAHIAQEADVPLPSIYHFFPNKNAILVALAYRFHERLSSSAEIVLPSAPGGWQDIIRQRQLIGAAYLNRHPAALRLFMGAGVSAEVRTLDLRGNASLAAVRAREFQHWFDCNAIPDLEHRIGISIGLMDGIWAVSWSEHGRITGDYVAESTLASIAYLRCYLPEHLPSRHIANGAA